MAFFNWKPSYNLGVSDMDAEHRGLLVAMQELYDLSDQGASHARQVQAVEALYKLTAEHFAHEEQHMEAIGFSDIDNHRSVHQRLMERLVAHGADHKSGKPLGAGFFGFLRFWLGAHICGMDTKYAAVTNRKAS